MTVRPRATLLSLALATPCLAGGADGDALDAWPAWRGPLGTGAAPRANPPITWSEDENVRWKVRLPGLGHSTPVVFGELVFVTTAVPVGDALPPSGNDAPGAHDNAPVTHRQSFEVLALDRATGDVRWRREAVEALPHQGAHVSASFASPSPVTDGQRVVASFGSQGLFAFDAEDGEELWRAELGPLEVKHGHGEGSSPALFEGVVVVVQDHEGDSSVAAFDVETGRRLWTTPRDEPTSWASPIVVRAGGPPQVVVSGTNRLRAYDLATGELVWEHAGLSHNVVASPVYADGVLLAGSSYERQILVALSIDGAHGDLTGTERLLWVRRRSTPYVPSPLLHEGGLWFLQHYQGELHRVDARTGAERPERLRLPGVRDVYASPVGAPGRVYVTGREGTTVVLSSAPAPRVLATNRLADVFDASAAIAGDALFLRGERHLYCLAALPADAPSSGER